MNVKPKVGIFTRAIDQKTSGSGIHLKHLVNAVLDMNTRFNIVLIHYKKNKEEIYKRTNELIIPKNPVLAHIKLIKEKFDILHYTPISVLSPIWLKKPKKVATIHGGGAAQLYFPNQYSKWNVLHTKLIKPIYIPRLDYIFTGAKASKNFISNYYKINEKNIFYTFSAADEDFQVYEKKSVKIKEKLSINNPFILHVSKFSERKNPWLMLKAFKILKQNKKEIKLVLAGKGWKNKKVLEFATKNDIIKDIIFTGFIAKEEIIELMNLALCFIFPSFFEGFGIPNLEAMACGCPVITSRGFAISEVVGDAALILNNNMDPIELAKKISLLMDNEKFRKKLIENGLKRVKLYSWKKSAQVVLNIYEKCLLQNVSKNKN